MVESILLLARATLTAARLASRTEFGRNTFRRWACVVLLASWSASPLAAQATRFEYQVAAGVVVPTGLLGRTGGVGALVRASISRRLDTSVTGRLRLDVEGLSVSGTDASRSKPDEGYGLSAYGVNGVMLFPAGGSGAYALVGIGLQVAHSQAQDSYTAALLGGRVGAGVRGSIGRLRIALEVATQGAVLSNYGSVASFKVGAFWPVTLGLTF